MTANGGGIRTSASGAERVTPCEDWGRVWIARRGQREQLAHPGDVMRACAAGQQAVVANAMEAARQHVNEEAADELGDGKRHRLLPIATLYPVILPFDRNRAVSE